MGYYIRFVERGNKLTVADLEAALQKDDRAYSIRDGELRLGEELLGILEINEPGDGMFDEEIEELLEFLEDGDGNVRAVKKHLQRANRIIALQVLYQAREIEATLSMIDPLWNWLNRHRDGLVQADGEGWYKGTKLICEVP